MATQFSWTEIQAYQDGVGLERCVYALVSGHAVVGIWYCQRFGTADAAFARANEALVDAWRRAGHRLFLAELTPGDWRRVVELNEILRDDLQKHVA